MISFDIFDTLVTRKTVFPYGIFLVVQRRISSMSSISKYVFLCNNFCVLRMDAERDARAYALKNEIEEITLKDIYNLLAQRVSVPIETAEDIMKIEIQEEIENAYPIWENINLLKSFCERGNKVVLISDMYLCTDDVRKILTKCDPIFSQITIYISSELKKTKRSGTLYLEIAKRESAEFNRWIHYGDNKKSDYLLPRMLGIDAQMVKTGNMEPWETDLGRMLNLQDNLTLQFFLGAARIVRMENDLSEEGKIGASLAGMILYPYVMWLISNCQEQGIKRLYFIARDGYVLKKVADAMIETWGLDIYTKYIYGSRKAWRVDGLSLEDRKLVLTYLEQEVDFSDDGYAFVDLHGSGFTMECLAKVLFEKHGTRVKAFYFDLTENRNSYVHIFKSFCSVHSDIAELFCRAPHGATVGYKEEEGKIIPRMLLINNEVWERANIYDYFGGIELFSRKMSENGKCCDFEDIRIAETAAGYCVNNPCMEVLNFMGNIPHCDGEEDMVYAPELSSRDIFMLYMWRTIEDLSVYYKGSSLKVSLLRTNRKCLKQKEFWEKNCDGILGKAIHRFKNRNWKCRKQKCMDIVIYAAGRAGKKVYRHLSTCSGVRVVAWTDMDYEKYLRAGLKVIALRQALGIPFDYLVIAIGDRMVCKQIYMLLMELGVREEKIIGYKDFIERYLLGSGSNLFLEVPEK
jgi:predicted HAD superfamily hydrolase